MFTLDGWEVDFLGVVTTDIILLGVAVCLVSLYSYIVLGSFSPIHFRAATAGIGMTGYNITKFALWWGAVKHSLLPMAHAC